MEKNRDRHDEKLQADELILDSPALKKADNFWFYNKWKVLIGAFVAVVLGVCIWQSCSKESYDSTLMYAGPYQEFNLSENFNGIQSALNVAIPYDYDGNGEKTCDIAVLIIYSGEQIKQMRETAASESRKLIVNTEMNAQELQKYDQLIIAGEYSVCLLDPTLYERVRSAGGFRKLSDVLGSVPETANDEYSIRFMDTEFAKYFGAFKDMPADTLLCLRTQSVFGGKKADNKYDVSVSFFKNIVEFKTADQ